VLGGAHQRVGQAPAPPAPQDLQLGDLAPVRLVLGGSEHHLDGPHDRPGAGLAGDDHDPLAPSGAVEDAGPEGLGPLDGERVHEADRRPAVDAVDEQFGQRPGDGLAGRHAVQERLADHDARRIGVGSLTSTTA
jgi:hypothetical protein